jgi:tRNA(Ile2) C34 agmatinyltransferase TiaS
VDTAKIEAEVLEDYIRSEYYPECTRCGVERDSDDDSSWSCPSCGMMVVTAVLPQPVEFISLSFKVKVDG